MFRRMIETSTKSTWWTILFELGSIIMHVILMVLIIVMASVIASSMTMWSIITTMKITTMATATYASIIAIIIITIATMGRIELSVIALESASIIILLSPSPLLRPSIWLSTAILVPVGSMASILTSILLVVVVIICIFILFFLLRGRGRWWRLLLWFHFTFTFLSCTTSCTFEWFG